MSTLDDLKRAVIDGNMNGAKSLVQQALDQDLPPEKILNDGLIAAMAEVGRLFECGEYYVPEMLVAARAMKSALALLRPRLVEANVQAVGKIVIGTVQGDLHDIGKNLVAIMMEGSGFQVIDLGIDVPAPKFVAAVREHTPDLVGFSALLTTTMGRMKENIQALQEAGLRAGVKVMVGGAPITEKYASDIGADIFARDAASAAARARAAVVPAG